MGIAKTYRIETDRLVIRCYDPGDAPKLRLAIIESLDHLLPWMPWAKSEPEELDTKIDRLRTYRGQFDLGENYVFGIFDKTENELIGSTGLHTRVGENAREIGYWINVKHINNGFATEAVSALTKVSFDIENLSRLEIHCDPNNKRSQNIPKKLGYQLEAVLENSKLDTFGNFRDEMIWSMSKNDYKISLIQKINLEAFDIIGRRINL